MRRTGAVCLLILVGALSACVRGNAPADGASVSDAAADSLRMASDLSARAETLADSLLSGMTVDEKIAQLFMPAVYASDDPYTLRAVAEYGKMGIGGIVLLKGNSPSAKALSDTLGRSGRIVPFVAIDAEWGLGMRLSDSPRYPSNAEVGRVATEALMFDYGVETARAARAAGINMVLGPVLDVALEGNFISRRSYGSDPVKVSELAIAYARGLESGGVVSVAKHFPGHGSAPGDTHRGKVMVRRSLHDLDSADLYPFKRYIEQGLSGVMVGHLAVPAIDSRHLPAVVSPTVIGDLLRDDMGFEGIVFTDALNMDGAEGNGADKAVEAGADIILVPADTRREIGKVRSAVEEGRISEADLDGHVRRILLRKALMMLRQTEEGL